MGPALAGADRRRSFRSERREQDEVRSDAIVFWQGEDPGLVAAVERRLGVVASRVVPWSEITNGGIRGAIATMRRLRCGRAVLAVPDLDLFRRAILHELLMLLCPSRARSVADAHGSTWQISWARLLLWSGPRLALALLTAPAAVALAYAAVRILQSLPRAERPRANAHRRLAAYVRAHYFQTGFGGTLAHAHGVLEGLRQSGYETLLISSDRMQGWERYPLKRHVRPPSTLRELPELQEIASNFKLIASAWRLLRRQPPSFIYQRHHGLTFAGAALARVLSVPLVLEFNSSDRERARLWGERTYRCSGLLERVERLAVSKAALVVTVSTPLRELLQAIDPTSTERVIVQANGVDPERFRPDISGTPVRSRLGIDPSDVVVGFAGSLTPFMGLDVLIDAAAAIVSRHRPRGYPVRFVVMGAGSLRRELEERARERAGRAVVFTGPVPFGDIHRYLAACDILVCPHNPGLPDELCYWSPIKLFEYMAMGKAIVATRVGQMKEVLEHGEDALLAPPGDAAALADAILRLAEDEVLRLRLGARARSRVLQAHTWEKNVQAVLTALARRTAHG